MNYLPVRLSTLKAQVNLEFKIYVKLPHKYVAYNREGGALDQETLKRLKTKKVKKLFINENDEVKYQAFLDERLSKAIDDPNATLEEKTDAAVGNGLNASDKIYEKPADERSYNLAKQASSGLLKILREKEEALSAILTRSTNKDSDKVEKMRVHSVNASSLSMHFGEYIGLKENEVEALGIAALYHDVGFSDSPEEIQDCFFKEFKEIEASKLGEYKQHPKRAVELLQDKAFASAEVLDLILTHEERNEGGGFPNALQKLTLIQEVHSLCCHFDREVTCLGKDSKTVVEDFLVNFMGQYGLDTLKKFKAFCAKSGL